MADLVKSLGCTRPLTIFLSAVILSLFVASQIKFTGVGLGHAEPVRVRGDIELYRTLLETYRQANGVLPNTAQGLKALQVRPETEPKPEHWKQLIDVLALDPWGREYIYVQPGLHNPQGYDLSSAGPDRKPGTADDISNFDSAPQGAIYVPPVHRPGAYDFSSAGPDGKARTADDIGNWPTKDGTTQKAK